MEENRLTVAYATDRNLYPYLPTVINSLLVHNPNAQVYVFAEDDKIDTLTHPNIVIKNLNIFKDYLSSKSPQAKYYLPSPTFTRLWMEEAIPESKVLWLDVDTIVDGDLTDLWNTDMGDNIVAGVPDIKWWIYPKITKKYINAGVLLMNLDAWRAMNFTSKAKEMLNKEYWKYGDQDIINKLCNERILYLNPRYNHGRFVCKDELEYPIKIYHWPYKPKAWDLKEKRDRELWNGYYKERI